MKTGKKVSKMQSFFEVTGGGESGIRNEKKSISKERRKTNRREQ